MNATRETTYNTLARRGYSVVGYSICTELLFDGGTVYTVTVHCDGPVDRTATVRTALGFTTFRSIDGRWHDSQGMPLAAADDSTLDRHVDAATGHRDTV